ncbi:tetratricopeptide repeat protein [soil metagenome]
MRGFAILITCFLVNFSLFSQGDQLARNYLDQGEYEKALITYQQLVKDAPGNSTFFYGLITAHQQLEDFSSAERLLLDRQKITPNNPNLFIELGYNAALQQQPEKAGEFYRRALDQLVEQPNYTISVAHTFEKYSLLDQAAEAYITGMKINPELRLDLPLARIYGEQGKLGQMFTAYLDLIDKEPEISYNLIREFDKYILEDPANPANETLRKFLLQRLQKNPDVMYNEMLAWLFIQQKEYAKAFAQEKAIYRRNNDLQRIIQLTIIAKNDEDLETAKEVVSFIIEETPSNNILLQAYQLLLEMKISSEPREAYAGIKKEFEGLLIGFGTGPETLPLQLDYANFRAFKMNEPVPAIDMLQELAAKNLAPFDMAAVKMTTADILVLQEKFNQALIFYSQVQNLVKNDEVSQQARFRVARTSYYKGDFEWAQNQLTVLKGSSSQLIANDAMELSLLIRDNSLEDSTHTALKKYARADLLAFQNKIDEAIKILSDILTNHKGEKIEDEALLKQARLFETRGEWRNAEANYLTILQFFSKDILADNATYYLAELYLDKLGEPDKAKEYYEQIIFNFPDSIYFVEARKNYRQLRGDFIE